MILSNQQLFRFSEAPIWDLQRAYYEEQGITAWNNDQVPQYITNNPKIATSYAEMIFGFLQDRAAKGHTSELVSIVELGAGAGRLAFHVLQELCKLKDYAGIEIPPFRYVMTDLAVKNIMAWQNHSMLQPFVAQGLLDFATFDAVHDTELHLVVSQSTIRAGDLKQPLLIVANYFFDSIPQDLIYVGDGKIFECDVRIEYPDQVDQMQPSKVLEDMQLSYEYRHAPQYETNSFPYSELISVYVQELEDSHILFPLVGLTCLERLNQLSQEGFLLITADKGDHRLDNWRFAEPPQLILHGSFSLTANYHAIQHVFQQRGGLALFTEHHYKNLNIGCLFMLKTPLDYANIRLAYRRFVDSFGPDDFFSMKKWVDQHSETMGLEHLLAFWRLGGYDTEFFLHNAKHLSTLIPDASDEEMTDLQQAIHKMWKSYYQIEQQCALTKSVGLLLFEMNMFEDALPFLENSVRANSGKALPAILYNLAICCYELEQEEAALDYLRQVLALEPKHDEALQLFQSLNPDE
ncbi:tetratricopeptide repeat protein [Paenibacillus sp. L3-i20]|uniref:tetratricopeptide repeat protein n=1 Tax=Paenibacillus sp. L3-i20 TaxID=2905833 RepID=UPI001EDFDA7A|nr:tetratricopeptide repeat protein [Paenibacillus sp. L3-i20]GKU78860.1 hypothetical protein L3i20_v232570 [Paenibacillus sp. L3-i20]